MASAGRPLVPNSLNMCELAQCPARHHVVSPMKCCPASAQARQSPVSPDSAISLGWRDVSCVDVYGT